MAHEEKNHIRFLTTNRTVCEYPNQLGYDFVVVGPKDHEPGCETCLQLLLVHNQKQEDYDLLVSLPDSFDVSLSAKKDRYTAAYLAIVLTSFVWILIILITIILLGGN